MIENLCTSCSGACCKGPLVMSLSDGEYDRLVDAGTNFITLVEPADHDQPNASYPVLLEIDPDQPEDILEKMKQQGETEPLQAGVGRYMLLGACGNLQTLFGKEICSIYPERPQVCRDFKMGGLACLLIKKNER